MLFWQGGHFFAVAMTGLALIAWHEYVQMLKNKGFNPLPTSGAILILLASATAWTGGIDRLTPLLFLGLIGFLSLTVLNYQRFFLPDALYNFFGVVYIGLPFAHFIALRLLPDVLGMKYFALALLGTWACDTAAYFGGTRWGRHKLCPPISPAKSIEGAAFGFLGCILTVALAGYYLELKWTDRIACGILVGLFCQLGDLVESALKRHMGVKDSGTFFPGHGGVLDRVDSLLFSIPVVYYYWVISSM